MSNPSGTIYAHRKQITKTKNKNMNTNHNANADSETIETAQKPVAKGHGADSVGPTGPVGSKSDGVWAEAIKEVYPWLSLFNGEVLLKALAEFPHRYVILPKWAADTPWRCGVCTRLRLRVARGRHLTSDWNRRRNGAARTTLLNVLSRLVRRPVTAANISSPAFFRVIEEACPTLLIDEADTFLRGNRS